MTLRDDTRAIQRLVGVAEDGEWGPITASAVLKALRAAQDGAGRANGDGEVSGGQNVEKPVSGGPGKRTLAGVIGISAAAALTATLALWEGKRNVGYFDIVGVATACYGDTSNVKVGQRYSDEECAERLERQALAHVEPVLECTPSLRGHDNQVVAAASLAYNIGTSAYCRSTVDRRFDAGDWRGACDAFLMWNRAGGREIAGLTNRRRYERDLCLRNLSNN